MRDSYQPGQVNYGTSPLILFILCLMVGMLGYLVAFGETLRASPMARVYIADMPELYGKPVAKR
ncbi:hypothetical protein ASG19_13830 [Rhizobium sp. Leaf306]|uniref:hypothetical protein n=1 Tax=Rhizobium sp. Leaf306 TaxID=1736330 RepID=UPI000714B012|nr:hypothetical protein [Rhizobium sp. Leaf306]KQQ34844.1 hypothetical protein ASG19_13830 [Rhizobium sp. Leaf306]